MKEEIMTKVKNSLSDSSFDAVLVFGYDNIQYLSGAYLHFPQSFPNRYIAVFWSRDEDPICIIPIEWETSFLNISWISRTRSYQEKPGKPNSITDVVAHLVNNTVRKNGKIGIDTNRISQSIFDSLDASLEEFELIPCDKWIKKLRIIKTPKELELLEDIAYRTDHGITGEAHHILVNAIGSEMGISENIRIHAIERELDEVGHHAIAQASTGPHSTKFWPLAPRYGIGYDRKGQHHEFVRMELNATYNGYWGTGARMLVLGEPTIEQTLAYDKLVSLREIAKKNLTPGKKASEVYWAIKKALNDEDIELMNKLIVGYGVGVTAYEPPYLSSSDHTVLQPGMVVVFNPIVKGPKGELMMGKDTFFITPEGNRLVGWYKDWREPFIANYTF
jgi:Xaa-Pro aminopeptidase